tara:strand:- start:568 stop:924 length:357 start_codon:yes stop_codon:yes gene_type:complete
MNRTNMPMQMKGRMKKKMMSGGGKLKKKMMSGGGALKMVTNKQGERVPFYAADGVGKMKKGGAVKMKKGGSIMKMKGGGNIKSKNGSKGGKKGGKTRGSGIAMKGVRPAKMVTMKGSK